MDILYFTCGVLLLCTLSSTFGYNVPYPLVPPRSPSYNPRPPPNNAYDPDLRPPPPPPNSYGWNSPNYQEKPPWYPPPQQPNYNQIPPSNYPPYRPVRPYYPGPPPYINQIDKTTTPPPVPTTPKPSDQMADVINYLGTRILLDHASTRGNFVFSPYGATSVLSVLFEGSSGTTARQLGQVLDLPRSQEIVRVGMRDLHRHLKTYFGHNGFLQGVDLSKNDTSLQPDFLPILRLYGYHVDDDNATVENVETTMMPDVTTVTPEPEPTPSENTGEEGSDSAMEGSDAKPQGEEPDVTVVEEKPETSSEAETISEVPAEPEPESVSENTEENSEKPQEESTTMEEASDAPIMEEVTVQEENNDITTEESTEKRKKRSTSDRLLFPDIALSSGLENSTLGGPNEVDPRATLRRFRLLNGDFTRPLPIIERKEILPFASLPGLRAIAALLPLEDPRYGLLILLPTDGRGIALKQLARDLTVNPLRLVLSSLRLSRLQATIPAFTARGPVVLTSSLQQLGIWDIFDPRLARLEKMSTDSGLFVRELEQDIKVDFGNVKAVHTRVVTARSTSEVLDAMRPFLYFVIDRESQTSLLAGKVEDPSTPRIFK